MVDLETEASYHMEESNEAQSLYTKLETERYMFLERARRSAELTIPTLVPPEGAGSHTKYYTPFQGVGARGVNNLASKLLLTLFPPNSPFFRFVVDPYLLKKMGIDEQKELKTDIDKALAEMEKAVQREIETSAIRVTAFEALRQLLVAGNALVYTPDDSDSNTKLFRMDSYCVRRDPSGNVLDIVIRERIAPAALPKPVTDFLKRMENKAYTDDSVSGYLDLYTKVERYPKYWEVYQEVCGHKIPESEGKYELDKLPYLALRFNRVDGENYGRGYVEEYIGDLKSLEALSQAIVEGSAAAARVLFMVAPNGTTRTTTVAEAPNGAVVTGNAADVSMLRLDKSGDFSVAQNTMNRIEERLAYAFLLNSAIQRNAERVTAQEIRFMAQELESSLGGTYSVLSQEFQLPLVNVLVGRMHKDKRFPKLPKNTVKPVIVAGIEALGRGNDLTKLDLFVAGIGQSLGQQAVSTFINIQNYLTRRATALGIDVDGLIRDDEAIAQQRQQEQRMEMMSKLGAPAIGGIASLAKDNPEMLRRGAEVLGQQAQAMQQQPQQ